MLKGSFFGNLMKGKADRQDEAKEFFEQAANCYKHNRDFESALEMYMLCADCEKDDQFKANYYRDGANIIKSLDTQRYVELARKAIEMFSISGRTS